MKWMLAMVLITILSSFGFDWNPSKIGEVEFVPLFEVKEFYNIETMTDEAGKVVLKNEQIALQFPKEGRNVVFNMVKFQLKHPVKVLEGGAFISSFDLKNMVDPVLRPSRVRGLQEIRTVFLDLKIDEQFTGKNKVATTLVESLEKKDFEVVSLKFDEGRRNIEEQLKKIGLRERGVFLQVIIEKGKKDLIRTTAVGPELMPSVAMGTGLHWVVKNALAKILGGSIKLVDSGISISEGNNYEKLAIPGVRLELVLNSVDVKAVDALLGSSITNALVFARKSAGPLREKNKEK